jgi:hypothetical protein
VGAAGDTQEVVNAYVDVARDREGRIKARIFGGADSAQSRAMARRVEDDRPEATGRSATVDEAPLPYFCTTRDPDLEAMVREATWLADAEDERSKEEVVADYEQTHGERPIITGSGEVRILRVRTLDSEGREKENFNTGEALTVAATFKTLIPVDNPILGIALFRNDEVYVYGPNTRFDEVKKMEGIYDGVYTFFIHYPKLPLLSGVYRISVALYDKGHIRPHCWHNQLYEIRVNCPRDDHGIIEIPHHWGLITHSSGDEEDLP